MYNRIMDFVILGAGRRGLRLARHLIQEKKSVTFLDSSPERCTAALSKLDCMTVTGSCTNIDKLKEAGCDKAEAVIAVTDSDEVNLVSCGIITSNWPNVITIAAIRTISYLGHIDDLNKKILGITHIVNPDQEAATRITGIIESGLFGNVIYFMDSHFVIFQDIIERGSQLDGMNLINMKKEIPGEYIVAGVRRDGECFTPSGETELKANDEIAIVSSVEGNESIFSLFGGKVESRLKRIVVVGGTRIARYLLNQLPKRLLRKITLIDKDSAICQEFIDNFPQILVLNDSITDEQLWSDETISKSDLMIAVTENDELNIITASYAKKTGVKRSIALIRTNSNYMHFAMQLDVDSPISLTETTVDSIMRALRGKGVSSLYSMFDGELEVYEYILSPTFKELGKALKDVKLRGKCIIAGVKRGKDENFIPTGGYVFTEGDRLLVAAIHEDYDFVTEFFGS